VVTCEFCGHDNPEGELLCAHCGLPLGIFPGDGQSECPDLDSTRRLVLSDVDSVLRWGTARLGAGQRLLLHIRGHDKPLVLKVTERVELGRTDTKTGDAPDVKLDAYGAGEAGVSRRHAALSFENGVLKVMDLGSANATYINGQKLFPNQPRILRDGDELRLGRMVIRVQFA